MNDLSSSKESLYATSDKIYPREVKGRFQRLRTYCVIALLGLFYLVPWLQWNGQQAILFDLPARKFHIFALTLWPQDFFLLTLLLILAGLSLFFFTAIAGRVWCGFACPQTVWTEIFIWMERWVEGTRSQQMKLAAMPWNATKIRKRVTKQFLWISFALFTGFSFVGYFTPILPLVQDFFTGDVAGWTLFWVVFYGFATYGNAGFMREQVCKYMCPYARFQSAMFDKDTLIVAYDEKRGEPRTKGKKRKQESEKPAGDCVDCGLCVQVCPTGIDIRDGLQYECIACAACIDVCDEVMEKVGLPTNLIRYSSESHDQGSDKTIKETLLRPRVLIYASLLSLFFVGFITTIFLRSDFQVDILRDRNALFQVASDGMIENRYQVRVMNKSQADQRYTIELEGLDNGLVKWLGQEGVESTLVPAGEIGEFSALVSVEQGDKVIRSSSIKFIITETLGDSPSKIVEKTRFLAPIQR